MTALRCWLQGEWHETQIRSGDFGDDIDVYPEPDGKPHNRKPEEMEVIAEGE